MCFAQFDIQSDRNSIIMILPRMHFLPAVASHKGKSPNLTSFPTAYLHFSAIMD